MALLPNDVVEDRYVVVRSLKTGGMGAIYEAVDRRLGDTPCALKELLTRDQDEDQELVLRKFDEEMRILASLNHRGIPRVRDYFVFSATRFIVMDLVDGQNLEELLLDSIGHRGRPLLPTQVVAQAMQILEVLQYLHGHFPPIIHRDLKPANVILEKSSQKIKVVDFGLARAIPANNGSQTAIASLGYAPLEQIQGRATVRSDIYALGATMYHLLTGNIPVPLDAGPVQDANAEIDDELARIVDKATAVEEPDRFQSATQMTEALQAWLEGRSTGLPRRRPRRKTQGRLTRKALPTSRPSTSELKSGDDSTPSYPDGDLVSPKTGGGQKTTLHMNASPTWGRWLTVGLSVLLCGLGLWLVTKGLTHMTQGPAGLPTELPEKEALSMGFEARSRQVNSDGTSDHLYMYSGCVLDLSVEEYQSMKQLPAVFKARLGLSAVQFLGLKDRVARFSYHTREQDGKITVYLLDSNHLLPDGRPSMLVMREACPKDTDKLPGLEKALAQFGYQD